MRPGGGGGGNERRGDRYKEREREIERKRVCTTPRARKRGIRSRNGRGEKGTFWFFLKIWDPLQRAHLHLIAVSLRSTRSSRRPVHVFRRPIGGGFCIYKLHIHIASKASF
jgi:hypothetical protein